MDCLRCNHKLIACQVALLQGISATLAAFSVEYFKYGLWENPQIGKFSTNSLQLATFHRKIC